MYTTHPDYHRSATTQKHYPFVSDPDGSSRRNAIRQLEADDREAKQAMAARLGRQPTTREMIDGMTPGTPPMIVTRQPAHDPDANPFSQGVQAAEDQVSCADLPGDRARAKRQLAAMRKASDEWDIKHTTELAHRDHMQSSKVQDAIADATAWFGRLRYDPSIPEEWVSSARERLATAEAGRVDNYWAATLAFEAEREEALTGRAKALDEQAAALKAEAKSQRQEIQQ